MKDRIKQIRKEAHLNQEEFGKRIGAKQSTVTAYECGNRVPLDVAITSICREFNVNESWLRTGEGEMHLPRSRADEIAAIVNESLNQTPEEARQSLIERLSSLNDGEISILAAVLRRMFP